MRIAFLVGFVFVYTYAMKKRSVGDLCHKHRRNAVGKAPDVSPVRLKSGKVLLLPVDDGLAGD